MELHNTKKAHWFCHICVFTKTEYADTLDGLIYVKELFVNAFLSLHPQLRKCPTPEGKKKRWIQYSIQYIALLLIMAVVRLHMQELQKWKKWWSKKGNEY